MDGVRGESKLIIVKEQDFPVTTCFFIIFNERICDKELKH